MSGTESSPYAYVTSLQYRLKNSRYKLLTGEHDGCDKTFFAQFALCSLEVVKYMLYAVSIHNLAADHPLTKDQLCTLIHFQSRYWSLLEQLSEGSEELEKKAFFDHIDQVWEILCMWERFIAINRIQCFP
jgi:hypothetical protein